MSRAGWCRQGCCVVQAPAGGGRAERAPELLELVAQQRGQLRVGVDHAPLVVDRHHHHWRRQPPHRGHQQPLRIGACGSGTHRQVSASSPALSTSCPKCSQSGNTPVQQPARLQQWGAAREQLTAHGDLDAHAQSLAILVADARLELRCARLQLLLAGALGDLQQPGRGGAGLVMACASVVASCGSGRHAGAAQRPGSPAAATHSSSCCGSVPRLLKACPTRSAGPLRAGRVAKVGSRLSTGGRSAVGAATAARKERALAPPQPPGAATATHQPA